MKEIYNFTVISFTIYMFLLKIGIKMVYHFHFIEGMGVPLTFGWNAWEGIKWNEHYLITISFLPIKLSNRGMDERFFEKSFSIHSIYSFPLFQADCKGGKNSNFE
jgi:hypothetical protein